MNIKPNVPTPKSHQANEDPNNNGGKEMREPIENKGMNKIIPKEPQIARIFQSLRTPCLVLIVLLSNRVDRKPKMIYDEDKTRQINAMKLIDTAESR